MISAWQGSGAPGGLLAGLAVTAVTRAIWRFRGRARRRDWPGLAAMRAIPLVEVSLALPLHLFLRVR